MNFSIKKHKHINTRAKEQTYWCVIMTKLTQCFILFVLAVAAEKWQAVYTILEAFGNSSTSMNTNASRFSHIISLDFDQAGQVASASIQVWAGTFPY